MAQRAKYRYRGQTRTRKSLRPGKRTVSVHSYCRRKAVALWQKADRKAKEWGF
jgi:hypothetical protein